VTRGNYQHEARGGFECLLSSKRVDLTYSLIALIGRHAWAHVMLQPEQVEGAIVG